MHCWSLSDNLRSLLSVGGPLRVGTLIDSVEERGFGLLLVILSLPSALPIPAPGYSTPFGIVLAILGLQMMVGSTKPVLPGRARRLELSEKASQRLLGAGLKFLNRTEKWVRPRGAWILGRRGRIFFGVVVTMMATLMIFPIPLTNTFPAMVIFAIGVSFSEKDGLVAVGALVIGCLAVALYAYVIYLIATVGVDGVLEFKEWIKGLLRGRG
ncbi:MAG: exopolysaccharide biosynthesis protein [Puniceicoccaceae bacterium]